MRLALRWRTPMWRPRDGGERTRMRRGATGAVLAAACTLLLSGCGVRLSTSPVRSPAPEAAPATAAAVAPVAAPASSVGPASADPSPAPSAAPVSPAMPASTAAADPLGAAGLAAPPGPDWPLPSEVVPPPLPRAAAPTPPAVAAAARRAAAGREVKAVLPAFDAAAQAMVARSGVPGAAVAIVAGDTAVFVRCFGVRRAGGNEPVDLGTVFQLGAVSEGFTSTMLASLVGDGKLAWDVPVHKYWSGFDLWEPWVSDHVTLRDLLALRS